VCVLQIRKNFNLDEQKEGKFYGWTQRDAFKLKKKKQPNFSSFQLSRDCLD